jgi:cephalosporin-C deacetylase
MAFFDMPLDQLQIYLPPRDEPSDFDAFWADTLTAARQHPLNARFDPIDNGLRLVESFDVTFAGYGGQSVKGWLNLPRQRNKPLPCVVEYIGYGGGRSMATDWLFWASAGFAHFIMDTRGQGTTWSPGDTPDLPTEGANPFYPGFMTQGVLDPKTYYYRRVFTDAVRAVEAARSHNAVDGAHITVTGGSQGGGITLAAAGLVGDIEAAMPDVPFLCGYRRATEITDGYPYQEIAKYCQTHRNNTDQVFHTLSYFDGINFAARAQAETLFSVGLMDEICPPSTVYAAYNYYAGKKDIRIYRYNHHEGGGTFHGQEKLHFLNGLWGNLV